MHLHISGGYWAAINLFHKARPSMSGISRQWNLSYLYQELNIPPFNKSLLPFGELLSLSGMFCRLQQPLLGTKNQMAKSDFLRAEINWLIWCLFQTCLQEGDNLQVYLDSYELYHWSQSKLPFLVELCEDCPFFNQFCQCLYHLQGNVQVCPLCLRRYLFIWFLCCPFQQRFRVTYSKKTYESES